MDTQKNPNTLAPWSSVNGEKKHKARNPKKRDHSEFYVKVDLGGLFCIIEIHKHTHTMDAKEKELALS